MQNTKVKRGQSLIDMTIQGTGSITDLIQTAILNDVSISDNLIISDHVLTGNITDNDHVLQFSSNPPATGIKSISTLEIEKGIGRMRIGFNFKVR